MKVDQTLSECDTKIDATALSTAVMTSVWETIPRKEKKRPDWFSRREKLLESFLDKCNRAYNEYSVLKELRVRTTPRETQTRKTQTPHCRQIGQKFLD